MAIAAGIPKHDAAVIAYASQFVDDSTRYDSETHEDGGLLFGITTAHHPHQSLIDSLKTPHGESTEEQRKIWVPFHFFPGGEGDTFHERILCLKDGPIVREMLDNHLAVALNKDYTLELIGICAHVYADTFSHYGFSGMSSPFNEIKGNFEPVGQLRPQIIEHLKVQTERAKAVAAGKVTGNLGHASVFEWPDRPYLHWRFTFTRQRPNNGPVSDRDNRVTFLEACEKLHGFFSRFVKKRYTDSAVRSFDEIAPQVKEIIHSQGTGDERVELWKRSGLAGDMPEYRPQAWEDEKNAFAGLKDSSLSIKTHAYRFHQAAAYHRYYVLKDLLPSHGIAVY